MSLPSETVPLDRDVRQRDIVPPDRLAACRTLVIGVGAIGRQVALQLAAVGVPWLALFDDDVVAPENLAPQGYRPMDLGILKVLATETICAEINPDVQIVSVPERFKRSTARDLPRDRRLAVFACVDSIATRKLIWESLRHQAAFFVDGRMAAEVIRVLAVDHPLTDSHYPTTLFAAEQAYVGACTARSTIYAASVAAGLMLAQFTRWLRQMPVDGDVSLNLLSMELAVSGAA